MWTPTSVTFGIRHQNVFGFLGRAGDILDAMNATEGTRFIPPKLFTRVQWPNPITARMMSEGNTVTVDFSIEGVILNVDLEGTGWDRQRVKDVFIQLVGMALPISRGDNSVNRIGIIDNYQIDHESPGAAAIASLSRLHGLGQPSDFSFRAAFRNPTDVGLVRAGVEDWRNTILEVATGKKKATSEQLDTLRVSIDHQIYFLPEKRYGSNLIHDHFVRHVEELQRGPLAGLMAEDRAAGHGR